MDAGAEGFVPCDVATDTSTSDVGATQTNRLVSWINTRPNWEKYIWQSYINSGQVDLDTAYRLFLECSGVQPDFIQTADIVVENFLPPEERAETTISLAGITNYKNINAIEEGHTLPLDSQLIVIFGANGVGKSGFSRLLANACFSRGERAIIPNIYNQSAGEVQADFIVKYGQNQKTLTYNNRSRPADLKRFYVFDNKTVPLQLDESNSVRFVPAQLKIFDVIRSYINQIEDKLNQERREKSQDNPALNAFGNESSPVKDFLLSLSKDTTRQTLESYINPIPDEDKALQELEALHAKNIALNIPEKKKELTANNTSLQILKTDLEKYVAYTKQEKFLQVASLIKAVNECKEIVRKTGIEQFSDGLFMTTGSDKWKALLLVAQELYIHEKQLSHSDELTNCLLCKQELGEKEQTLFDNYWKFLSSKAEEELKQKEVLVQKMKVYIQKIIPEAPILNETNIAAKIIGSTDKDILDHYESTIGACIDTLAIYLTALSNLDDSLVISEASANTDFIDRLIDGFNKEIKNLKDPSEENAKISHQIMMIKHKQRIRPLGDKLISYLNYLRWKGKIDNAAIPKMAYTKKRTELFNETVSENYRRILNEELRALGARVNLSLISTGADGQTLVKLSLGSNCRHNVTEILSEGEQKSCAIADFLTEVRLDTGNCGIILDDPVTSLDHERKKRIAKRLVEESKNRQVIIFTHDVVFLLSLQSYAENDKLNLQTVYMRRLEDKIGIVDHELPWVTKNVKARKGYLRMRLQNITAMVANNISEDLLIGEIKTWYVLLRESWERAVEERLFKSVVQRYHHAVHTLKLSKVEVTRELIKEIEDGMTESSAWMHDKSESEGSHNIDLPAMENCMRRFESFIEVCKAP